MWNVEMPLILRVLLNDLSDTPIYSDARLIQLILVSAQLMKGEVILNYNYVIDQTAQTITPDPTDIDGNGLRDDDFINLTILKSACLLANSKMVGQSFVSFTDELTKVDRSIDYQGKRVSAQTMCEAYTDAKILFVTQGGGAGRAVVGPCRTWLSSRGYFNDPRYFRYDVANNI